MSAVKVHSVSDDVSLIDLAPPIEGFEGFLGAYVLSGDKIALIDVGPSSGLPHLLEGLETLHISPQDVSYVFITHLHIDHAGAMGGLIKYMPEAKVIIHEKGRPHLIAPERLWEGTKRTLGELAEKYGPIEPVPEDQAIAAKEGMTFDLGKGTTLEVLLTPGHASHHLSLYDKQRRQLFAGEAAGVYLDGAMRPGSPPPFELDLYLNSLDRLISLNPSTLCYGHFGSTKDAVQNLQRHRDQLALWISVIADCFREKIPIDQIYQRLREVDELMKGLEQLPIDQLERERFFLRNSLRGFLGYFEKHGIPKAAL